MVLFPYRWSLEREYSYSIGNSLGNDVFMKKCPRSKYSSVLVLPHTLTRQQSHNDAPYQNQSWSSSIWLKQVHPKAVHIRGSVYTVCVAQPSTPPRELALYSCCQGWKRLFSQCMWFFYNLFIHLNGFVVVLTQTTFCNWHLVLGYRHIVIMNFAAYTEVIHIFIPKASCVCLKVLHSQKSLWIKMWMNRV